MDRRIAVIGMAGRFPDAIDLKAFYHNLQQAKCSIREISAERIRRTTLDPGAKYGRRGYMENIDEFDYQFFNIPYGEAIHMDPHQRLLLEVTAEAMENCGYSLHDFNDTNTAVYVTDRKLNYYEHADRFDPTLITGNSSEFLAARISRVFNLKGGVAVIDTSCSSGLVAIHNACNELRLGLADQALVCGVNLELFPVKAEYHIEVESPDGLSVPFSAASNGMVYGEAAICVVLKPLVKALQDKDNIQAVITGSAVNNNAARAASLTSPDSIAQAEVLRKAWAAAGIEPGMLGFIEAHGSGTQLGDSLEIAGINLATEPYADESIKIPISTVKSNIGHTRSVAGLAGFVKAVLSVNRKMMLPSVYSDPPNPHLQLASSKVYIQQETEPCEKEKVIGGVTSIGFSGTNCHVVVEQAKLPLNGFHLPNGVQPAVFLFSSWREQELNEYIERINNFLDDATPVLDDLAFTLGHGRDHYEYRKAFVAHDLNELKAKLSAHDNKAAVNKRISPKLIFIFSAGENITHDIVEACCRNNRYFNERYLVYLDKVSTGIERTAPQIFRFIFQLAHYDLMLYSGIETPTLLGVGTGQLIARVVRNEMSLEEALKKAYETAQTGADAGLEEKLEKLLQSQTAQPTVFIDLGLGSNLYPLLWQHAAHGNTFFVHRITEILPVLDIANVQCLLYEKHYAAPKKFFNGAHAHRIEAPAHPFSKTRCWIREEPKKKPVCQQQQTQAPAKNDPGYTNTIYAFIAAVWKEVLELPMGSLIENFFESGGDSIKATKVIRRLNESFGIRLDFEDLFDYPSLESFAALVASQLSNEQKLMLIWKEVLRYADLTPQDNFFEKGGHSLMANQVLNRMKAEMKVKVDFEDFFRNPSVYAMCRFLETRDAAVVDEQIPAVANAKDYPVSHLQRRLWILGQIEESSVAYNEFNAYKLQGKLNLPAFRQAMQVIIERHESFRTIFTDGPRQVILPYSAMFEMQVEEAVDVMDTVRAFAKQPFVLAEGPLLRTKLIKVQDEEYVFLFNIHHIIFDEWSNQVFIKELFQLYTAFCAGKTLQLEPLRVQYKDYAAWLQNNQASAEAEKYWLGVLKDGAPVLKLPADLQRPPVKTYNGSSVTIQFPAFIKDKIDEFGKKHSASSFMSLTALTALLLHRYSGQNTIMLGTPVAGRKDVEMERCIGFFANTVVLKIEVGNDFVELLQHVKQQVAAAYTHQLYPFDQLVEQLDLKADRSRTPLFDVMIGYQKNTSVSNDGFEMQGIKVSGFGQPRETSKFDLSLDFFETASGLSVTITYNTDLFLRERIERMAEHFCLLVEQFDYRTEEDKRVEQVWTNPEKIDIDPFKLFNEQVKQRPSATAIGGKGWRVTYEALSKNEVNNEIRELVSEKPFTGYIQWFTENIPVAAGDKYFATAITPEIVWAGLATGLALMLEDGDVHGLIITDQELQILDRTKYPNLKWIIANGVLVKEGARSILPFAEIINNEIKPFPGVACRVVDALGMPAPIGISGRLEYNIDGWKDAGLTCRWDSKLQLQLDSSINQLLQKKNIGQLAVSPGNKIFITPRKQIISKEEPLPGAADRPGSLQEIEAFNNTDAALPSKTIIQYINEWAQLTPANLAVTCLNRSFTYAELNQASDNVARGLLAKGIAKEEIVPVLAERSVNLLVCMLGIMKAGAVYLPIGTDLPANRIEAIVEDCGAKFILRPEDIALLMQSQNEEPLPAVGLQDLAYIIYTSGSTGKPKGVMIEHAGMMNHIYAKIELLGIDVHTKIVQNAPQSFDISIWQFLSALVAGGQTIIYPDSLVEDPRSFARSLSTDNPQILEVVPSYLGVLLDESLENWKPDYLLVTGEAFAPKLAARWFQSFENIPLVNAYGPTEASDDITHHVFTTVDPNLHRLPIGRPVRNMKIYIVDANMQLCAVGTPGEICVSGIGVGRGYINQPERTKEVFIDNPWQPGTRMYKTGDVGYFNADGVLEFLGRKDHQVKIHGHRIETSEIEHCLCQIESIQHAVVLAFRTDDNDFLSAWVMGTVENTESIKEFLKSKLPPYMVPAYIFVRDEFPLTSNGKIDRKAFSNPELYRRKKVLETEARQYLLRSIPEAEIPEIIAIDAIPLTARGQADFQFLQDAVWASYAAPSAPPVTEVQKAMAEIWKEVLHLEEPGIDDDFFEKGGHSLKGMRLLAAIENKFNRRLSLRNLFSSPTIRLLCERLDKDEETITAPIPKQAEKEFYPASYAQRRMWVMSSLGRQGHAYNICGALQLKGRLDLKKWNHAWKQLIQRHEILRTGFKLVEGEVMQFIVPANDAAFNIKQQDAQNVEAVYRAHEQMIFDLENPPLLRGTMLRVANNEHVFIYVLHHIISDEWSLDLLSKELLQLYTGAELAPLTIQYRDYASWQHEQQHQISDYWQRKIKVPLPVIDLPIDGLRPAVKTYEGSTAMMTLNGVWQQLNTLGAASGSTMFMLLSAAVKVLLHRYCGQDDIIIGTPVAGRNHPQLQNSAGLYLNTLALRTNIKSEDSFYDVIKKVRQTVLEAFDHQDYPFDKLVEELEIKKDLSRSALFDVFIVQHDEIVAGEHAVGSLDVKPYGFPVTSSKFDLGFHFRKNGNDVEAGLNFNTSLFSAERAKLMLEHFNDLLAGLLNDPSSCIYTINYFTNEAAPVNQAAPQESICTYIRREWAGKLQQQALNNMSFEALDKASSQLANYLQQVQGVKHGQVIGLYMDRSTEMIVSLLGIIKAGGTYLPMDKSFPAQRLAFMLEDSDASLVICDEEWPNGIVWNEAFRNELKTFAADYSNERTADSIVYIIYTSGTSGKPKGVRIADKSIINYALGISKAYNLQGKSLRGLLASSVSFDLGYTCLWGMLLLGGELHLLPQTPYWQPAQVLECINNYNINFIKLTPSHFRLLVHEILEQQQLAPSLQWIILGGEKPSPADMELWLQHHPHCMIANHYGPSETTIGVITQLVDVTTIAAFAAQPVLGQPMGNHHVYIVDKKNNICAPGVWGELLIGGPGLSPGYVNRPELTAQKFITYNNTKVYRTGDRCRKLLNGKIEFSGRLDGQVQLKGYRIELEEIENVLMQLKEIAQAAATIQNEERLVAFVVPAADTIDENAIRAHISKSLPAYMMPSKIIQLDSIPLTGNGKTDRNQLPDASLFEIQTDQQGRAPKNKAEEDLLTAFEALVNNKRINLASNFFELGGDSIKAIQLASKLYALGWKLDIKEVFDHPILEEMAKRMQVVKQIADQRAVEGEVELSPIQHDFFNRGFLFEHHYNQSILLRSAERIDAKLMLHVIKKLFTHHDALRMTFRYVDGKLQQFNRGTAIETEVFDIDLQQVADPLQELAHQSQNLQESFDLEEGPLFKVAIFRLPEDDRLLLAAHHLVVDGVSWRIILEDLQLLYQNQELKLGLKTDSFKKWTSQQQQLASTSAFKESQSYWFNIPAAQQLIWDNNMRSAFSERVVTGFELDEAHTGLLLTSVQHAYHTEINELFLAALVATIAKICHVEDVWIDMEGHGRENIVDADVSRTVGWFTSVYPVLLSAAAKEEAGTLIRRIKEQLRAVPQKGMGFGMLKYLADEQPAVCAVQPEIIFNYLGQFDDPDNNDHFSFAPEYAGSNSSADEKIRYPLAISGRVLDDRLRMNLEFDPLRVSTAEQDAICLQFEKELLHIIYHCASRKDTEHTASDFQYKEITQDLFETLFD